MFRYELTYSSISNIAGTRIVLSLYDDLIRTVSNSPNGWRNVWRGDCVLLALC